MSTNSLLPADRKTVRIENPGDPRISAYRDIRERDLVGREGRFVAEGKVVLKVLFESAFETESVLVLENRLPGMATILNMAPAAVPIYVASRETMDTVAGFAIHRGILAIGRRSGERVPACLLAGCPLPATVIALIGLSNHDNMGAVFRNAAAFGAGAVLLDSSCCDPLYRKSIRVSVGAALKVPYARTQPTDDLLTLVHDAGFEALALSPRADLELSAIAHPGRLALLLGSEGDGLPPEILHRSRTARIGMAAGLDSLNVATAGAIALHHFYNSGVGKTAGDHA